MGLIQLGGLCYLIAPHERDLQWTETGIAASFKFINRVYELIDKFKNYESSNLDGFEIIEDLKFLINQVTNNIESFQFNKSVANIYEFVNTLNDALTNKKISKDQFKWSLKRLSIILQPFAPHISEEIWSSFEEQTLCINQSWPIENMKKKTKNKIAIQINGKTKNVIEIDGVFSKESILEIVKNDSKIKIILLGKKILREIYVPGKIVNLVIK